MQIGWHGVQAHPTALGGEGSCRVLTSEPPGQSLGDEGCPGGDPSGDTELGRVEDGGQAHPQMFTLRE